MGSVEGLREVVAASIAGKSPDIAQAKTESITDISDEQFMNQAFNKLTGKDFR